MEKALYSHAHNYGGEEQTVFEYRRHSEIVETMRADARGHAIKDRYGRRVRPDFYEAYDFYTEQFDISLNSPEPENGEPDLALEMVQAMHELQNSSLHRMGREKAHSRASNCLYRIGQIAWRNKERFLTFAGHPDETIAAQAMELLGHSEITMRIFDFEPMDETSFSYAMRALDREIDVLNDENIIERTARFIRTVLISDDSEQRDDVFAYLYANQEKIPSQLLNNLQLDFTYFSRRDKNRKTQTIPSAMQLRTMSDIYRIHKDSNLSEYEARKSLQDIVDNLPFESSTGNQTIKRQIIEVAQAKNLPQSYIDDLIEHFYDIDSGSLRNAWANALGDRHPKDTAHYSKENIGSISLLEISSPGSARYLFDHYRIKNFSRFPIRWLERQYSRAVASETDPRASDLRPLTNMFYVAEYDHNGLFAHDGTYGRADTIAAAAADAGQDFEAYEVSGVHEIITDIESKRQKIGSIMLSAHGSGPISSLSQSHNLTKAHMLLSRNAQCRSRLSAKFAAGATGIFNSCHTGKDDELGQVSSDFLGIRVFAPLKAANIDSIDTGENPGPHTPLDLTPVYTHNADRLFDV